MMAVGNINAEELSTVGLQYVVLDVFGSTVGKLFLISVVIAITVCCLAVHTAAIRMMFAMARDNNLPAGTHLARVDPVRKTPGHPGGADRLARRASSCSSTSARRRSSPASRASASR